MCFFSAHLTNGMRIARSKNKLSTKVWGSILTVTDNPAERNIVRSAAPSDDSADGSFDQEGGVTGASTTFRRINPLRVVVLAVNLG